MVAAMRADEHRCDSNIITTKLYHYICNYRDSSISSILLITSEEVGLGSRHPMAKHMNNTTWPVYTLPWFCHYPPSPLNISTCFPATLFPHHPP